MSYHQPRILSATFPLMRMKRKTAAVHPLSLLIIGKTLSDESSQRVCRKRLMNGKSTIRLFPPRPLIIMLLLVSLLLIIQTLILQLPRIRNNNSSSSNSNLLASLPLPLTTPILPMQRNPIRRQHLGLLPLCKTTLSVHLPHIHNNNNHLPFLPLRKATLNMPPHLIRKHHHAVPCPLSRRPSLTNIVHRPQHIPKAAKEPINQKLVLHRDKYRETQMPTPIPTRNLIQIIPCHPTGRGRGTRLLLRLP
mmetsp:Transcript_46022/g.76657  ORF Transcript_46022/g.76657 Transcript_46022/m.76657 type:complete len:249 (+) Transcript_46022:592-1338(+)